MTLIELQTASAGNLNIVQAPVCQANWLPRACLFGLSQSTQNVMQYIYVDVKERLFRYNSK